MDCEGVYAICMNRQNGLVMWGTGMLVGPELVPLFGGELQEGGYKEGESCVAKMSQ